MATLQGERFNIDLDSDEEIGDTVVEGPAFIGDVQERVTSKAKAPAFKGNATGFPKHKKRTGVSRFKQNRTEEPAHDVSEPNTTPEAISRPSQEQIAPNSDELERQKIDDENKRRLASMSESEIEQERQELFAGLSPAFIQKLLRRSNIDDEAENQSKKLADPKSTSDEAERRPSNAPRKVSFALPEEEPRKTRRSTAERHSISDGPTQISSGDMTAKNPNAFKPSKVSADEHLASEPTVHFPKPPKAPELDPESSSFLDDLHEKYFPGLAHDPSKLAWMAPPIKEEDASYDPLQAGLQPSDVRFSFKGALIPPSMASSLSTDLGLHHHGDAPSAAGYTIAELAMLARSSYPAQRCVAFQTLGRILYRLGTGEFGTENDIDVPGPQGDRAKLARGLWAAVKENRILDTLTEEAKKDRGHQTSIAMAQEAVWNWRKGGGREMRAV